MSRISDVLHVKAIFAHGVAVRGALCALGQPVPGGCLADPRAQTQRSGCLGRGRGGCPIPRPAHVCTAPRWAGVHVLVPPPPHPGSGRSHNPTHTNGCAHGEDGNGKEPPLEHGPVRVELLGSLCHRYRCPLDPEPPPPPDPPVQGRTCPTVSEGWGGGDSIKAGDKTIATSGPSLLEPRRGGWGFWVGVRQGMTTTAGNVRFGPASGTCRAAPQVRSGTKSVHTGTEGQQVNPSSGPRRRSSGMRSLKVGYRDPSETENITPPLHSFTRYAQH